MTKYTNKSLYARLLAEYKKDYDCEDYRYNTSAINRVLKKALSDMCVANGMSLAAYSKGYFEGSAFIKRPDGLLVYVSIGDIRFDKERIVETILFRAADDVKDYTGHSNDYSDWEGLPKAILTMPPYAWERSKW